ncbi:MAG: ribonuclease P protein component [Desulfobulbaceae bacterium]|nr:MAG: ribonuclease P protein component [Desulfobulbaceae bacterium]
MGFKLPKTALLRNPAQYSVVYRQGKRLRGAHFSLIYIDNDYGFNRLGISVHGVKKAVLRNRMKRIIREFFRLHRDFLPPGKDIVFAVRKECALKNPHEISVAVANAVHNSLPNKNGRRR